MNKFLKSKLILLLLPIIVIIFTIISLLRNTSTPTPSLLATDPAQNSQNASVFDPISLQYSTPLDPSLISVSSIPTEDWSYQINDNTLTLNHDQFFHTNQQYSISIYYDRALLTTLNFKTHAEQNDPRYLQSVMEEMNQDYPLGTSFPYETPTMRVVYSAPTTLEITLKSNSISEQEAISQVKTWVKKNGGDPTAHSYQVANSPSTPPTASPAN